MKKLSIPKINSIHFGGLMLAFGALVGIVIPIVVRLLLGPFLWPLCVIGGGVLLLFAVMFGIEMHQDGGKVPYYERHLRDTIPFDPDTQVAVIRSSICTGEKVAGFRNKSDGHFTEVMLISTPEEEMRFRKIYQLGEVKKEY